MFSPRGARLFQTVLISMSVFLSLPAIAVDHKSVARESFNEGTRQYDLGEYKLALAAFKKAYVHFEEPAFLFNIAQCHRQLSERADALRFYKTYLKKVPEASNRDEVQRLIVLLEGQLRDEKTAQTVPPTGTMDPAVKTIPAPAPIIVVEPTATPVIINQHDKPTPVYKKWWLWTTIGVVVVGAAVGATLGVVLSKPAKFDPTLPSWGPAALTVGF